MRSKPKFLEKMTWHKLGSGSSSAGYFNFYLSVRIKFAAGLDYLRLKKYPWIPLSLTVTILDRLEKPFPTCCLRQKPGAAPALFKA